jgi:hypothetical protein
MRRLLTAAVFAAALTGCAALLPYLVAAGQVAQWVTAIINQVEPAKDAYFDARPSPDLELRIDQAIARTRAALAALDAAVAAAQHSNDGDVEAAKAEVLRWYEEVYRLSEQCGLLGADGTYGGPGGTQLSLPSPQEVEARL